MVYDKRGDRLLIWADYEIWQKPRLGEASPFYISETNEVAWYPVPIIDPTGNVWFVEDKSGAGILEVVKAAPDGTILDRSPTPAAGNVPFPQISFNDVSAWEFTTIGELWIHHWRNHNNPSNTFGPTVYAPSSFFATNGSFEQLDEDATGWTWRDAHGNTRRFDSAGRLTSETDRDGNQTGYQYNASGRITSIVDPVGATTTFTYNGSGKLAGVADPAGRTTQFVIDASGNLVGATLPNGDTPGFVYDSEHRIVRKIDPCGCGRSMDFTIDAQGHYTKITYADGTITGFAAQRVIAGQSSDPVPGVGRGFESNLPARVSGDVPDVIIDPRGNLSQWRLDERGYLRSTTDAAGITRSHKRDQHDRIIGRTDGRGFETKFDYDKWGNIKSVLLPDGVGLESYEYNLTFNLLTKRTDANGNSTTFTRDAAGKVTKITNALGQETSFTYNARGQVLTQTDPLNRTTTFAYDTKGNLQSVTDPLGHISRNERDGAGRVIRTIDAANQATTYAYDALNRLLSATAPDGGVTTFVYDSNGNRISARDPLGNLTRFEYDEVHQLVKTIAPDNSETRYTYDAAGNRTQVIDALGNTTTYTYDSADRLTAVTDPLGRTTRVTLDGNGNAISRRDPLDRVTQIEFDAFNRPTRTVAPDGGIITYVHDRVGNLTSLTDANSHTRQFAYDAVNRPVSEIDALGQTRAFQYDAAGNLVQQTRRDGAVITRSYDSRNILTQVNLPAINGLPADQQTFTYDARGNLLTAADSDTHVQFSYDALSRPANVVQTFAGAPQTIAYTYDLAGRRATMLDTAGTTRYTYDVRHLLAQLVDSSNRAFTFGYDAVSRLTQLDAPNAVITTHTYDATSQLLGIVHRKGATVLAEVDYTYDLAGNRSGEAREGGFARAFAYDPVDRLLSALSSQPATVPTESFVYDKEGNWTVGGRAHDADNRLTGDTDFLYTYDAEGNLTEKRHRMITADVSTYTYDALNRLVRVVTPTSTSEYRYDALGYRVAKIVNGVTTRYVLDGDNVRLELDGANAVSAVNHHAGLDTLLARDTTAGTDFPLRDGLGSTMALTDAAGSVTERYRYSSFGQLQVLSPGFSPLASAPRMPYTYTGRDWEPEAGVYFYRARYYSPTMGRFLSQDPIGLRGGRNHYAYVDNNPINFLDPFGLEKGVAPNSGDAADPSRSFLSEIIHKGTDLIVDGAKKVAKELAENGSIRLVNLTGGLAIVTPYAPLGGTFDLTLDKNGLKAGGGVGVGIGFSANFLAPTYTVPAYGFPKKDTNLQLDFGAIPGNIVFNANTSLNPPSFTPVSVEVSRALIGQGAGASLTLYSSTYILGGEGGR